MNKKKMSTDWRHLILCLLTTACLYETHLKYQLPLLISTEIKLSGKYLIIFVIESGKQRNLYVQKLVRLIITYCHATTDLIFFVTLFVYLWNWTNSAISKHITYYQMLAVPQDGFSLHYATTNIDVNSIHLVLNIQYGSQCVMPTFCVIWCTFK